MTEFVDVPGGRIAYDVTAGRCPAAPRLAVRIRLSRRGHPCRSQLLRDRRQAGAPDA